MIHRFLSLGKIPELRSEPTNPELEIPEVEVLLDVQTFWDLTEVIKQIHFERSTGQSASRHWQRLVKLVRPRLIWERDRLWFAKNIGA